MAGFCAFASYLIYYGNVTIRLNLGEVVPIPGHIGRATAAALLFAISCGGATATPFIDAGNKGPLKWAEGSTILVYVPADPDKMGRDTDLIAGIKEWNDQKPLKDRNIKIETRTGTAPPGTANAVQVSWVSGPLEDPNDPEKTVFGRGRPSYLQGPMNMIDRGTMLISRDTTQVTKQMAKNLGIHEMGHVLGLDDVKTGSVKDNAMFPDFTKNDTVTITTNDTKELDATYSANQQDTQVDVTPQVTPLPEGNEFRYDVEWQAGSLLGLFQVDVNGAKVLSFIIPDGWEVAVEPRAIDVDPDPRPFLEPQDFVTFRIADQIHYLSEEFPSLTFGFVATGGVATVEAMLNGRFLTTGPIPQPAAAALFCLGLVAMGTARRRAHR